MTNALIDNSTLTAVERVVGRIPVKSGYDLSADLSAFESYLSAILFYDEPSRVDDYKQEFSEGRAEYFTELNTIYFEASSYSALLREAKNLTSDIFLKISGGEMSKNPMSDFLEDMELYVSPAWIMQSSDFYLRIRLLADESKVRVEKYSPLMSAIFEQLSENNRTAIKPDWRKELVGSDGKLIQDRKGAKKQARVIGSDINAFSAGLNWLALRSVFYALCSEHLAATAVTHPIRGDFLAHFYTNKLNRMRPDQRAAVLAYFRATATDIVTSSNEILGGPALKLRCPLISAWAVTRTGSPTEARAFVLDKRFSPEGIALRARMRDIEDLHQAGDAGKARRAAAALFRDFEAATSAFFRKFGKRSNDPYAISADFVSISGSFALVAAADRVKSLLPRRRNSVSLLRNITLDLLRSPTLGVVADQLRSEARCEDGLDYAYSPKIDHPRFRNSRSSWKEPM